MFRRVLRIRALLEALILTLLVAIAPTTSAAAKGEIVVFAAASLKDALDDVADAWTSLTGYKALISFAGSAKLARQIQYGAPADVFVSASTMWMDVLDGEGLIDRATRHNLLQNQLVLIAHVDRAFLFKPLTSPKSPSPQGSSSLQHTTSLKIDNEFDLASRLGEEKLAMAMVDSVPAGIYGKAALEALGLWDAVTPKVAQTDNVRAALTLVARGETPAGIVYATDVATTDRVSVVGHFPADSHPPIVYPVALVAESANVALGRSFLSFLLSPEALALFEKRGFETMATASVN
ncbi:MAG: molybdate ABC transporter substrate-binding protein [Hyphomicrobiaceae bacterium]